MVVLVSGIYKRGILLVHTEISGLRYSKVGVCAALSQIEILNRCMLHTLDSCMSQSTIESDTRVHLCEALYS